MGSQYDGTIYRRWWNVCDGAWVEEVGHWGRVLQSFVVPWSLPVCHSSLFPVSHLMWTSPPCHTLLTMWVLNHEQSQLPLLRCLCQFLVIAVIKLTNRWVHICSFLWLTEGLRVGTSKLSGFCNSLMPSQVECSYWPHLHVAFLISRFQLTVYTCLFLSLGNLILLFPPGHSQRDQGAACSGCPSRKRIPHTEGR